MYLVERTFFISDPQEEIQLDQAGIRVIEAVSSCLQHHELGDLTLERLLDINDVLMKENRLIYGRQRSLKRSNDGNIVVCFVSLFQSKADYELRNRMIGFKSGDDDSKLNSGNYGVTVSIDYEEIA